MKSITKNSLLASILTGSVIFYALSGLTAFFNYIYYPALARLVDTEVYGEIQFLTSLFMQLSVGFVVLNILSIVITAKYTTDHQRSAALKALNTIATTVILFIICVGSGLLLTNKTSFGFTGTLPILLLSLSLLINVPFTILLGRLQGEGKFALSGVVGALNALFKFGGAIAFVLLGFGTPGAIAGMIVGMLLAMAIAALAEGADLFPSHNRKHRQSASAIASLYIQRIKHFREERSLLLAALIAMGVLTTLSTADIFMTKLLLDGHSAGQYAGVATIAKIILYAATPLMWLALPLALANTSHTAKKINTYLYLTIAIGVVLTSVFTLFPRAIVHGLLGIDVGDFTGVLSIAGIAMTLFSIAFIRVAVDLCRDKLACAIYASLGALTGFISSFIVLRETSVATAAIISQIIAAFIAIIVSIVGNTSYAKSRTH